MNQSYDDILSRIADKPKWFDEHAVPRFCDFSPNETANIYASEAVLFRVSCQGCGMPFDVAMTLDVFTRHIDGDSLATRIREKELHYGDPPNVGCCAAGPTMNSEPRHVLQYWRRDGTRTWQRVSELEVNIEPDWVRPGPPAGTKT